MRIQRIAREEKNVAPFEVVAPVIGFDFSGIYSLDPSDRRLMGYDGDSQSVTVTGLTAIPETARIGDSGPVGVYTDSDGSTFDLEWWLEDGFNGRALLVLKSTGRTASGVLDNTTETRYLIEPDGTRIWMELESYNTTVDLRVTLSGYY